MAAIAPLALLVAGCATVPGQDRLAEKDPLEKFNRAMWSVNMTADRFVMRPITKVYRKVTPQPARAGIHHFFTNVTEPWSFVNNLLQGQPKRAGRNLKRFVINTTIGLGGLIDRASKMGIQPAPEDLGQTLAVWGVNGGPYLVLPLLGPSTMRDAVGTGVASYGDPVTFAINRAPVDVWDKRGYSVAAIVDARSELIESGGDAFLKSSLDPYAAARSAYLQRRRAQILNQEDMADAGPPDDDAMQPPAETTPTPAGNPAVLPQPRKGDTDAAPPALPAASTSAPDAASGKDISGPTGSVPQPQPQPAPPQDR